MNSPPPRKAAFLVVLLLATSAIYWPGIGGAFLFDDYPNIVSNARVHMESLDWPSLRRAALAYAPGDYGRPLATLGFAFDYWLGGKDPWGYKVHSLLIHLLNVGLVFVLARRLLGLAGVTGRRLALAAAAITAFWAVHPLLVSTVLYVVQRMELLAHTFVFLSLIAYLEGRQRQLEGSRGWPWLAASALAVAVGMLGKESAILVPVYALAVELTLLHFRAGEPATARALRWGHGIVVVAGLVGMALLLSRYTSDTAFEFRGFTAEQRLLSQLRVVAMYLGQILLPLPSRMPFYYDDFEVSLGLFQPMTTFYSALLLAGLLGSAFLARRKFPLYSLGILLFFGSHALTSNAIPLEMVYEHRNYFGVFAVGLAIAGILSRARLAALPALVPSLVAGALAMVAFFGFIRSATWGNEFHLANELVALNPESPRASNDLATLYYGLSNGNWDTPHYYFAIKEFERGAKLKNSSPLPEQGLILMSAAAGRPVEDAWWESLEHKLRTRPIGPQEHLAISGLMRQHRETGLIDGRRIAEAYQVLLARREWPGYMYARLGDFALESLGDQDLAKEMFSIAVTRDPADEEFAERVVGNLVAKKHTDVARSVLAAIATSRASGSPSPHPPAE